MSYIKTLKELKLQTFDLTDFSKINLIDINPINIKRLPQEQKNQWFILKSKLIYDDKYDYSKVVYVNAHIKVEIICPIHGSFFVSPTHHLVNNSSCKICSDILVVNNRLILYKKQWKKFLNIYRDNHGSLYNYHFSNYLGNKVKVEIVCTKCESNFWQTPSDHVRFGCPKCKQSRGETQIFKMLIDTKFETQWNFNKHKDLRGNIKNVYLSFDFYLPKYNLCIEYDGKQHFEPIDFFGGMEGFIDTQRRDNLKNQFCLDHNIKLVRIPHWVKLTPELILQQLEENFTVKTIACDFIEVDNLPTHHSPRGNSGFGSTGTSAPFDI